MQPILQMKSTESRNKKTVPNVPLRTGFAHIQNSGPNDFIRIRHTKRSMTHDLPVRDRINSLIEKQRAGTSSGPESQSRSKKPLI